MCLKSPERFDTGERSDFFDAFLIISDFISRSALLSEPKNPHTYSGEGERVAAREHRRPGHGLRVAGVRRKWRNACLKGVADASLL